MNHETIMTFNFRTFMPFIVNLASLTGFILTVAGMIISFNVIAQKGLNNPAIAVQEIFKALVITAAGLSMSILVPAFYCKSRRQR